MNTKGKEENETRCQQFWEYIEKIFFFLFYQRKNIELSFEMDHSSYLKYRIYEYERKRRKRNTFQRCQQLWEYMEKIWEQVPKNIFNAPLKSLKFYQE